MSWPETAIQNRKCKISMFVAGNCRSKQKSKINMFMTGKCRSLCHYASRLDQRLLGASSWMNWIVNGLDAKCHGSGISWLSFVIIDNRMLKIITSVFIVTRRLENSSVLKFICFKLLGHCNIFTFSLVFSFFYILWLSLCVGYLIDNVYLSLAFYFWHLCFGIRYLAFVFWHLLFGIHCCFKKHFVSISIVTCWHLYSTHAFKGVRSLPKAALVVTLGIQTRHSVSIRLHVHLNILEPCYQCSISFNNAKITLSLLTLVSCKIICFLM